MPGAVVAGGGVVEMRPDAPAGRDRPRSERTFDAAGIAAGSDLPGVPDVAVAVTLARHLERGGDMTPVGVPRVHHAADVELRRDGATVTRAVVGGDGAVAQRVRDDVTQGWSR